MKSAGRAVMMRHMELIIADPTGLCFGVKRAIENLEQALERYRHVYSFGSPIHNPQEVERLCRKGLVVVHSPEEIPVGSVSFVRAHGVSPRTMEALHEIRSRVIDGTCPFVRTAQERARALAQEGYQVVILGDENHPEVRGIVGYVESDRPPIVLSNPDDLDPRRRFDRCGVLSQTTQRESVLEELVKRLVSVSLELKVYNTICKATIARQESIVRLVPKVDGIIVIGGRNSANTGKMVEIARAAGVETQWIEHSGELDGGWLENKRSIGVAAGGSTPDWLIKELTEKLRTL